ncbi:MAG: hypothetical protein NT020_10575 [Chloroflexales bacterium]|nr:hypothetical protein [Chloroflexales bacterium]
MLPSSNLALLEPAAARNAVAHAIALTTNGAATITQLAQWALKAYHSLDTADLDESDAADTLIDTALIDADIEDDDDEIVHDPLIVAALDALMFADAPPFALDNAALQAWYERLRAV